MTKKEHAIEYCTMKLSEKCASLTVNGRKIVYSREANVHTGKSKHMQMLCLGKESCELFIARCFVHYQSLNFLTWEYSPSRNNCRYFDWEGWEELGMFTRIICFRDSHTKHFGVSKR